MQVKLRKAGIDAAENIWKMQREAFFELLEKYQDYDTNPGNEPIEKTILRLQQPQTHYYYIEADGLVVGAIRVIDPYGEEGHKRIAPIFIMPTYQNRGLAQQAIIEAERIHGNQSWLLDTIMQEAGNCHLYEKMGYHASGKKERINDALTLIFYEK